MTESSRVIRTHLIKKLSYNYLFIEINLVRSVPTCLNSILIGDMLLRNFSRMQYKGLSIQKITASWIHFETFKAGEESVDEETLVIGKYPPPKEYNSKKLNNPGLRMKKGYEKKFLQLMEAKHRGFDEQNNTQYGYDQFRASNNE